METPDWLATATNEGQSPNTPPPTTDIAPTISHKSAISVLNEIMFSNMLEDALERVSNGHPLKSIVDDDPRGVDYGKFYTWLLKDPIRRSRYYEAREIGAEMVADELLDIADASTESMEDVARSTLRVNTRKWLLGVWNRKRYGDDRTIGMPVGAGGITINFGTVASPYTIEADNTNTKTITDV